MTTYFVTTKDNVDEIDGEGYFVDDSGNLTVLAALEVLDKTSVAISGKGAATFAAGKWDSIIASIDEPEQPDDDYWDDILDEEPPEGEPAPEDETPESDPVLDYYKAIDDWVKKLYQWPSARAERAPSDFPTTFGRYA